MPCSISAKGCWGARCLEMQPKTFDVVSARSFPGFAMQVLHLQPCPWSLFSWKDIWPCSRITETGGICLGSPELKKRLAPTSLNLLKGWHHLYAGMLLDPAWCPGYISLCVFRLSCCSTPAFSPSSSSGATWAAWVLALLFEIMQDERTVCVQLLFPFIAVLRQSSTWTLVLGCLVPSMRQMLH